MLALDRDNGLGRKAEPVMIPDWLVITCPNQSEIAVWVITVSDVL